MSEIKTVEATIRWWDFAEMPMALIPGAIENLLREKGFKIRNGASLLATDLEKRIEPPYWWWDDGPTRKICQMYEVFR